MNVLFLDIDGVLNSESLMRKLDNQHRALGHHGACECYRLEHQIDRDAVARLNRLVIETGSRIVISSSWRRLLDPAELHRVLVEHGLSAEIIGETPDCDDPELIAEHGRFDLIDRGHEIDLWLRRHPEVERFIILDDGSDMAMHKNRLVQTDCEVGLVDEDVELAIRMMSWDGKSVPQEDPRPDVIAGVARIGHDAIEDFIRRAEEHIDGGTETLTSRLLDDAVMNLRQLLAEFSEHAKKSGSSWGIHCHYDGCPEKLELSRTTAVAPSYDDDYQNLGPALLEAAVSLGWRTYRSVHWCPTHVVVKNLACSRCNSACFACSCEHPPMDAVDGVVVRTQEKKP